MPTQILAGLPIAAALEKTFQQKIKTLAADGINPCLAVIIVGSDPASRTYVNRKVQMCRKLGIGSVLKDLPGSISQDELDAVIDELNADRSVNGILCQVPLPAQLNEERVIHRILADKDVDCFHPFNVGCLTVGDPVFMPCTPFGVLQMLHHNNIAIKGKRIGIIGRSNIVGRPLSILLSLKGYDATVTLCHSATKDISAICRESDILITALGKPGFITGDMLSPGSVVIDVGINRVDADNEKGFRLVGDVDWESIQGIASAATPVPGGIGPLTIMMLMYNTINAALLQNNRPAFSL